MNKKLFRNLFAICFLCLATIMLVACGGSSAKIDYNLASKGDNFTYSTVVNMQSKPQGYIGSTFKIRGKLQSGGGDCRYLTGYDAESCCNWSLEVKLKNSSMEFPANNKTVCVIGDYKYYKNSGKTYYYLEINEFV